MEKIEKNLKSVFVVSRNGATQIDALKRLERILTGFGLDAIFEPALAAALGRESNSNLNYDEPRFVLSLGGDGNFIGACRRFAGKNAYIFGVHTGHLGFLTDVTLDELGGFLARFFEGDYKVESVRLLEARFKKDSKITFKHAFNDVVFMRKKVKSTAHIDAYFEGEHFNSYYGDGVIVSSAMGSTAYNMSAGGAIIHPSADVFALTPVCSHSLTQRPLVLPSDFRVEFRSNDDVAVLIDGQDTFDMRNFDGVEVGYGAECVNIIHRADRDYFGILKEKLRWGHYDK